MSVCFNKNRNPRHGSLLTSWWFYSSRIKADMVEKIIFCLYFLPCSFLVTPLCLTLCDPMDYSPPGSSVHENLLWNFPDKNTGMGSHSLFRGLLDYRQIFYCLSHLRSPFSPVNICSNSWMTWGSYQQKKQVLGLFQALPTTLWFLRQCSTILTLSHSIIFSYLALIIVHP